MRLFKRPAEPVAGLVAALAVLAGVLLFLEPTALECRIGGLSCDQWCADAFYWPGVHRWAVDADGPVGKLLFYTGPKALIIALSAGLGALLLVPGGRLETLRRRRTWLPGKREALYLLLCLALIPLSCNRLKVVTNLYCPYEHARYGGKAPYVRLWDEYPPQFKAAQAADPKERGRGFPAGHASGGFALTALAFTLRRRRWLGIALGAGAGWWMGLYQMAKGAHYLSHTLVSWSIAWILAFALALLLNPAGFRDGRADGNGDARPPKT